MNLITTPTLWHILGIESKVYLQHTTTLIVITMAIAGKCICTSHVHE